MTSKIKSQFVEKSNQLWQNHQDLVLNLINTLLPEQQSSTESEIVEKFSQLHPNHQDLALKLINTLLAVQNPPPRKKPKFDWIAWQLKSTIETNIPQLELQKVASDLMDKGLFRANLETLQYYGKRPNQRRLDDNRRLAPFTTRQRAVCRSERKAIFDSGKRKSKNRCYGQRFQWPL